MNPEYQKTTNPTITTSLQRETYQDFELFHTPEWVAAKRFSLPPGYNESTIRLLRVPGAGIEMGVDPQGLSERYTQTLIWGAFGKAIEEQAKECYLSPATVKTHRSKLFERLGATSMTQAVHLAFRHEILQPMSLVPPLKLTPRQRDVLIALSQGGIKEAAAQQLALTRSTVHTHTDSILSNNLLRNVTHAVTMGHLSGDIPLYAPSNKEQ